MNKKKLLLGTTALSFFSLILCWKILYPEQSAMVEFISGVVVVVFLLGFSEMVFCSLAKGSVWFISRAFHYVKSR